MPASITTPPFSSSVSVIDPTIGGTAEAGTTVTVRNGNGAVIGTAVTAANGSWAIRYTFPSDGNYTVSANNGLGQTSFDNFRIDSTPNRPLFGTITTDPGSVGGQVYELYQTILGRAPDARGFEVNVAAVNAGASLSTIAQNLLASGEYTGKYGNTVASDDGFINQLYQNGLHRQADQGGLQTYENALANGATRAQVAIAIGTSTEARNVLAATFQAGVFVPDERDSAVARLFYGTLNRAPDAGGLQANEAAYANGASLGQLTQGFLGSVEYQGTVAGQSNLNYIQGLYKTALGRTGDAAGLQLYETGLDTGSISRANVANAFLGSAEFQNDEAGQSNASYIDAVYQAALGRHVDADGLQFWQGRLDNGLSRVAMARGIVGSTEFSTNVIGAGQQAFIQSIYEGALGRDPGASETQFWQGVLNSGASQAEVATSISQSPEAVGHLVPKIEAGYHIS